MDIAIEVAQATRWDRSRDDDFSDRLLRTYTFGILVGFAIVIGAGQFFGDRISCIVDQNYNSGPVAQFIEQACYLNSTYSFVMGTSMQNENPDKAIVSYYQWSMLIIILVILLLLIPSFLWKTITPSYRKVTEISRRFSFIQSQEAQQDLIKKSTMIIRNVISHHHSTRLSYAYLFVKFATVLVIIFELLTLQFAVAEWNIFTLFTSASPYNSDDSKFPLLTRCQVPLIIQAEELNYVGAHCILPNNILLYYFFVFFIYWFTFLLVIALFSFISWCVRILGRAQRLSYVRSRLHCKVDPKNLELFVDALGYDGVFMLHMISRNGSDLFCSMLVENLYNMFLQSKLDFE